MHDSKTTGRGAGRPAGDPRNIPFICAVCGAPISAEGAGGRRCGVLQSNRTAADDNPALLADLNEERS